MIVQKTSEWVSTGHPDKMADYISSYLLDICLMNDSDVRYAVEVQIKDNFVSVAGEITFSNGGRITPQQIEANVKSAVRKLGYTKQYRDKWGRENVPCEDDLEVVSHISGQSPDIAKGLETGGWGDQGIFWGMATNNPAYGFMPEDYWRAREIGYNLFHSGVGGLDIKTQVTMSGQNLEEVVVAIPVLDREHKIRVERYIRKCLPSDVVLHVNSAGDYLRHGSMGDCGTTGRKLAVDFYGGNCRIGGGSPWTKDGTKADLSLNLLARFLSVAYITCHPGLTEVHTAISSKIGQEDIRVQIFNEAMQPLTEPTKICFPTSEAIRMFSLKQPYYAERCLVSLFAFMPAYTPNPALGQIIYS